MRPRKPFQFSLASLMLVVTAYAVLFGLLRWLRLPNPWFVMVVLYVTMIVYCQWALFDGRHPTAACVLTSGGVFVLAMLAVVGATSEDWFPMLCSSPMAILAGFAGLTVGLFITGAVLGIGAAGIVDLGLLVYEAMRGSRFNPVKSVALPFSRPGEAASPDDGRSTRSVRLAVLAALAMAFLAAMLWAIRVGEIPVR